MDTIPDRLANLVTCTYCQKEADRRNSPQIAVGYIHGGCLAVLRATAQPKAITRSFWHNTTWNRAELWWQLACFHSYRATKEGQKAVKCRSCAEHAFCAAWTPPPAEVPA